MLGASQRRCSSSSVSSRETKWPTLWPLGATTRQSSHKSSVTKARLQNPMFANVKHIDGEMDKLALPTDGSLDFVLIHLNYHDLVLKNDNRAAMNKAIFAALKPGGVYGIVDHYAKDGSGSEFTESLHRIDKAVEVKEVTDAGFVLAKEGEMLRHPEDPRTEAVFKHRGETDRFVLRFEKPK